MFINFPPVEDVLIQGMEKIKLPRMLPVAQRYDPQKIEDLDAHIRNRMAAAAADRDAYRGKRICVTAGSRGIPHMAELLATICRVLREWGADPFVIPAMGSHGGGTAEGQLDLLAGYGVTEERIGAPILASMDVVSYGHLSNGIELFCDRYAWEADGVVVFHKVKPHTDFRGRHESGLAKMIAIGLSKHKGAAAFHAMGFDKFAQYVPEAAEAFLSKRELVMGIGVVQNAFDDICAIEAAERDGFMELDERLLEESKQRLAQFKFHNADILVIDEIGKNISGWGHDPNVTGRTCVIAPPGFSNIFTCRFMVILGLTEESHHNGCGLAAADMTTRRCLNDVDWGSTWTNMFNNMEIQSGSIPMYANSDREALLEVVRCLTADRRAAPRIVHIRNTQELSRIEVSESLYEEIRHLDGVEKAGESHEWAFDQDGFQRSVFGE